LLEEDRVLITNTTNQTEVRLGKYYGFKIYEDSTTPEYNDTTLANYL
jgi:hypothetical protein